MNILKSFEAEIERQMAESRKEPVIQVNIETTDAFQQEYFDVLGLDPKDRVYGIAYTRSGDIVPLGENYLVEVAEGIARGTGGTAKDIIGTLIDVIRKNQENELDEMGRGF